MTHGLMTQCISHPHKTCLACSLMMTQGFKSFASLTDPVQALLILLEKGLYPACRVLLSLGPRNCAASMHLHLQHCTLKMVCCCQHGPSLSSWQNEALAKRKMAGKVRRIP